MTVLRTTLNTPEVPPAAVRPVRRDPKSGWWLTYPAYEGWKPEERNYSSWWLVLAGACFMLAMIWAAHV